jgi:excisionase family DNA binding protein
MLERRRRISMSTVTLERLAFGIQESAQLTGLGKSKIRNLIRDGALPAVRVGDRVLIRKESLEKLLQEGAR